MDTVAESIAFVPDLPDIATTWTEGLCWILLLLPSPSCWVQAPYQKAGLQPGLMLGGDPEEVCLRQVGGLQGER